MNQQREQEALRAAQREQELREQEQAAPEKEELPQNSDFRKLIGEICGTNTIPETESDEVIKSSVKNLVPILSESKVTSDNEKFSGELAHNGPIPPRIEEADFDLEEEIRLVENFFDSQMEEIDLFLDTDDFMPSGIKNDDYDSEGDIYFLEELLSDYPFPLPKNKSFNFDHHNDLLFSHPPLEPPDIEVFFDPDTGVLTAKVVEDISEHYVVMPKVLPYQTTLCLNIDTLLLFSFKNKDKRTMNVVGARENVCGPVVQQFRVQCFNCKEFGHFAKECRKPKRVKDSAYHKKKMLLCKQAEKGVPLQAEQYDWLADMDEEINEQELEAHYS
nr:hypothetical protein [Tanacetum cinerariifolium]